MEDGHVGEHPADKGHVAGTEDENPGRLGLRCPVLRFRAARGVRGWRRTRTKKETRGRGLKGAATKKRGVRGVSGNEDKPTHGKDETGLKTRMGLWTNTRREGGKGHLKEVGPGHILCPWLPPASRIWPIAIEE